MRALSFTQGEKIFKAHMVARRLSPKTVYLRLHLLKRFFRFLKQSGRKCDLRRVGRAEVEEYILYIQRIKSKHTKKPIGAVLRKMLVDAVKKLFRALYLNEYLLTSPLQGLKYLPKEESARRATLSEEEIAKVLDGIKVNTPNGFRDRVLYELMYQTGLRVGEVIRLRLADVDAGSRMLFVQGKGSKPRLQPLSDVAIHFLTPYLKTKGEDKNLPLFKGRAKDGRLTAVTINKRFKAWCKKAGIVRKHLSIHSIRHSIAGHLLSKGAGIRYVQEFLGHESIATTTTYTHLLYENMKRIYKTYHPSENECYREVEPAYLEKLALFKRELKRASKIASKRGEYLHKRYLEERKSEKNSV
jgi:integrase/recombinase XerD